MKGRIRYHDFFGDPIAPGASIDLDLNEFNPYSGQREIENNRTVEFCEQSTAELGVERAFIVKDGYCMSANEGDKGSVSLSVRSMNNIKDATLTHNHPRDSKREKGVHGGTFSPADISMLSNGCKELRAVSHEEGDRGVYTITKVDHHSDPKALLGELYKNEKTIKKRQEQVVARVVDKFEKGGYKSKSEAVADSFNRQLKVLHRFYAKTAPKHGYVYEFRKES